MSITALVKTIALRLTDRERRGPPQRFLPQCFHIRKVLHVCQSGQPVLTNYTVNLFKCLGLSFRVHKKGIYGDENGRGCLREQFNQRSHCRPRKQTVLCAAEGKIRIMGYLKSSPAHLHRQAPLNPALTHSHHNARSVCWPGWVDESQSPTTS